MDDFQLSLHTDFQSRMAAVIRFFAKIIYKQSSKKV